MTERPIREFVLAGHGNLDRVKELLAADPTLIDAAHEWQPGDTETAIQAAAHVGNPAIARFLLEQGAPLAICTAAMLGERAAVEALLQTDPAQIQAVGAHGIPLLAHAAFSGDVELFAWLVEQGAQGGVSSALQHAVVKGHTPLVRWILEHGSPDLTLKNYQGLTALDLALEHGQSEIAALLRGL
jgi:ankyrin repeat protein